MKRLEVETRTILLALTDLGYIGFTMRIATMTTKESAFPRCLIGK